MDPLQLLVHQATQGAARQKLHEALPAAATLPDRPQPRLRAPRAALAAALHRTANRLEPHPAT